MSQTAGQDQQWSRHAANYDELFLDPFRPGVENPILDALAAIPEPETKTAADLGCGTGPLLPHLVDRFQSVVAVDFAPGMIACARKRLGPDARKVAFETRPMHQLDDYRGRFDAAFAINSLVMPDVREIDRALRAIHDSLAPGGVFFGVVPSIDAVHYSTMLLMDRELDRGQSPEEAERLAAHHAEHHYFEFAFGRFLFHGLRQKFWQPFEIEYRLRKAGFATVELDKVLYPWDDDMPGGAAFADQPKSWDWAFTARP